MLDNAILLLSDTIQDDSLYFLVEWREHKDLTIMVTNDTKASSAPHLAHATFTIETNEQAYFDEKIREWTRDYLTTSHAFMRFSLVAIFSTGDRKHTTLL
jgi:hypothetical protein